METQLAQERAKLEREKAEFRKATQATLQTRFSEQLGEHRTKIGERGQAALAQEKKRLALEHQEAQTRLQTQFGTELGEHRTKIGETGQAALAQAKTRLEKEYQEKRAGIQTDLGKKGEFLLAQEKTKLELEYQAKMAELKLQERRLRHGRGNGLGRARSRVGRAFLRP